jgi:glycosyl transferase family 25
MKYFIVNADKSRQDNVDIMVNFLGEDRINCESVHSDDLDSFYSKNYRFVVTGDKINTSEVGCFASHYNGWKYVVENDLENLLIIEDDSTIESSFIDDLNYFTKFLPKDYDTFFVYYDAEMSKLFKFSRDYIGNDFICKAYQNWSTQCYLISNRGAKKLIELTHEYGMTRPVDNFMLNFGEHDILKNYAPMPPRTIKISINKKYPTTIRRGNE